MTLLLHDLQIPSPLVSLKNNITVSLVCCYNLKAILTMQPIISLTHFSLTSKSSPHDGKHPNLWILDTGVTDHITFTLTLFVSYHTITLIYVLLPNDTYVITYISGSVNLSSAHIASCFIYPSFQANLIYIPKLALSNNCFEQFTSDSFHILQNITKVMVGIAKMIKGLYVIDSTHVRFKAFTCNSLLLQILLNGIVG